MTWLIVDGNNWFAQCDFASPDTSRANFEARLRSVYKQIEPTRVIVAWDEGESWRQRISSSYKAHRGAKPDGYAKRLRETRESVEQFPNVETFFTKVSRPTM